MEGKQRVLIIGNSLILAGIEASLRASPSFEVTVLDSQECEVSLHSFEPCVVIFDLGVVKHEYLIARMQVQPGMLLIGIDPESHDLLLSGEAAHSISLDQLTRIVASR